MTTQSANTGRLTGLSVYKHILQCLGRETSISRTGRESREISEIREIREIRESEFRGRCS
jgi:hypothetical protein